MKVNELRNLLKEKDLKLVNEAFVEVYKLLQKQKKEEADVLIESILNGKGKVKKVEEVIEPTRLFKCIDYFTNCAYQQLYIAPNRIIPKSDRPKWRFEVKKYIKNLLLIQEDSEYFEESVHYLGVLYKLLADSCGNYYFSTNDPFRSVGISQEVLYEHYAQRLCKLELTDERLKRLIKYATTAYLSSECLHVQLYATLRSILYDRSEYDKVIDLTRVLLIKEKDVLNKRKGWSTEYFQIQEGIEELCQVYIAFKARYQLFHKDYDYYYAYQSDKETALYRLLETIDLFGNEEQWIDAYEYALKKKINPNKHLTDTYQKLKAGR